ncbi:hypothetical protein FB451DRAFT_1147286 [Mycena latifolia]|nr:hypothetical protein FB451DRAFT_1147286 [Mycena latifolia]
MGKSTKEKENDIPGTTGTTKAKRCRWNGECDSTVVGQLHAEKAAGNQTDNAGWHQAAWTACSRKLEGSEIKSGGAPKQQMRAQYQLIKALREKSGWGWDDDGKHIVVEDSVWDAYLAINPKIRSWRFKGFPLFDEMAQLIDGAVATGVSAFQPGQPAAEPAANAPSPEWSSQFPDEDGDDDDDFPLDPALKGATGRFEPPPIGPGMHVESNQGGLRLHVNSSAQTLRMLSPSKSSSIQRCPVCHDVCIGSFSSEPEAIIIAVAAAAALRAAAFRTLSRWRTWIGTLFFFTVVGRRFTILLG